MADTDYMVQPAPGDFGVKTGTELETIAERTRSGMVVSQERRSEVLRLRRRGFTYEEIAQTLSTREHDPLDISTDAAKGIVRRYLQKLAGEDEESVGELRALENERLDELLARWLPRALGNAKESRPPDPKAAAVVLRIHDQRAKLNGLYAPTKIEHGGKIGHMHEIADPEEVRREREAFRSAYDVDGHADELPIDDAPLLEAASVDVG